MPKRCFIIHGWDGFPEEAWFPWLKAELEKKGFEVTVPAMPHPDTPTIADWVPHLAQVVGKPDEQTFFVGHSIGCQTILRYLETLAGQKVGGCVCVAGWFDLENMESEEEEKVAGPWLTTPIDFAKVRAATSDMTAILSDNDPYNALEFNKQKFQELGAKIIIEHDRGHFNGLTELPSALQAIMF